MQPIKKQIVTDESMQPVAVIINYSDWQNIESMLQSLPEPIQATAPYPSPLTRSLINNKSVTNGHNLQFCSRY
jgi:hypothetical protein